MSDGPSITPAATDDGAAEEQNSSLLTGEGQTGDENTLPTGSEGEPSDKPAGESEGEPGAEGEEGKAGGDDQGAPEAYDDFTLPEGIEMDEAALAEATEVFKELNLNQEQAQKLVDLRAKMVEEGVQKQAEQFSQLIDGWKEQTLNDKEFGGEAFEQNIAIAQQAIAEFGTPELKQLMEDHGVGNHPEMVRFMFRVGQKLQQDVPGSQGQASTEQKSRSDILYPNS